MVNRVILVGHLGKNPELRALPNGQSVANFSLATTRRFKGGDGSRQQKTEWHQITIYGKQAELAGQYLVKGKLVYLEGRIETQSWEDKASGERKYRTQIVCESFQLLGAKGADNGAPEGEPAGDGSQSPPAVNPLDDDDIPF